MEYTPRYAQPFTLSEAIRLDVSTISEEITRLQNSLQHLKETQDMLREHVESELAANTDVDPEITKALEENTIVIGSQEERVGILKMALNEKGVSTSGHYDLAPASNGTPATPIADATTIVSPEAEEEDEGIHL